jgi:hypothetical protein
MIEENWVRFAKISPSRIIQNVNVFYYLTRGPSQPSVDGLNFDLYVDGHFFPDSRKS